MNDEITEKILNQIKEKKNKPKISNEDAFCNFIKQNFPDISKDKLSDDVRDYDIITDETISNNIHKNEILAILKNLTVLPDWINEDIKEAIFSYVYLPYDMKSYEKLSKIWIENPMIIRAYKIFYKKEFKTLWNELKKSQTIDDAAKEFALALTETLWIYNSKQTRKELIEQQIDILDEVDKSISFLPKNNRTKGLMNAVKLLQKYDYRLTETKDFLSHTIKKVSADRSKEKHEFTNIILKLVEINSFLNAEYNYLKDYVKETYNAEEIKTIKGFKKFYLLPNQKNKEDGNNIKEMYALITKKIFTQLHFILGSSKEKTLSSIMFYINPSIEFDEKNITKYLAGKIKNSKNYIKKQKI